MAALSRRMALACAVGAAASGALAAAPAFAPRPVRRPPDDWRRETRAEAAVLLADAPAAPEVAPIELFTRDADRPIEPASTTKLMTALLVFEALADGRLTEQDRIATPKAAFRAPGSTMYLRAGERVRVIDLLRGLVVVSGNDAAITLAHAIEGSEAAFARAMTARAGALGLGSARFLNATGLPAEGHVISPADLARLARHLLAAHPDRRALFAERSFEWAGVSQDNRHPALGRRLGRERDWRVDGLKTGHTRRAGYCIVATASAPERRGGPAERVIAVLTGLPSERRRAEETVAALAFAVATLEGG